MDREGKEAIQAEEGFVVRSAWDIKKREWFSLRGPDGGPKEFERLVTRLRARNWAKKNPIRRLEITRLYGKRHRAQETVRVRTWRHTQTKAKVFRCANRECAVEWCRVPGGNLRGNKRAIYCSPQCFNRERYLRRKTRLATGCG
jgi:hypothetical protein